MLVFVKRKGWFLDVGYSRRNPGGEQLLIGWVETGRICPGGHDENGRYVERTDDFYTREQRRVTVRPGAGRMEGIDGTGRKATKTAGNKMRRLRLYVVRFIRRINGGTADATLLGLFGQWARNVDKRREKGTLSRATT